MTRYLSWPFGRWIVYRAWWVIAPTAGIWTKSRVHLFGALRVQVPVMTRFGLSAETVWVNQKCPPYPLPPIWWKSILLWYVMQLAVHVWPGGAWAKVHLIGAPLPLVPLVQVATGSGVLVSSTISEPFGSPAVRQSAGYTSGRAGSGLALV